MATYQLTAERDGLTETVTIEARNDADAIANGSFRVMELAYPNVELWAKGAITLTDAKGVIVQTMAEK